MSDTIHPLVQLCNDTNLKMFVERSNYELYTRLKAALEKDGHDTFVRDDIDSPFPKALVGTNDMMEQEGDVLRAMIDSWAQGVLAPMLERLNAYNKDSEDLTISMEGYLHDATLCFDGDLEEFMENLEISIMPDFKEVCDDWKHTLDLIVNFGDMVNAVDDWHDLRQSIPSIKNLTVQCGFLLPIGQSAGLVKVRVLWFLKGQKKQRHKGIGKRR